MPVLNDIINQISFFLSHENDDLIDRYHYRYSVISLAIFMVLHASKQYYGEPIQCTLTANSYGSQDKYIHSICWLNGTHKIKYLNESIPERIIAPAHDDSDKIQYYQWLILIIIGQCLLFTFPSVIWNFAIRLNGFDLVYVCRNVIKKTYLDYYSNNADWIKISRTLDHVTDHLRLSLLNTKKVKKVKNSFQHDKQSETSEIHPDTRLDAFDTCFIPGFTRKSYSPNREPRIKAKPAFPLYWSYIFVKLTYLLNIVLQFLFLCWMFGFNYLTYAPETLNNILIGNYSLDSSFFPKRSICVATVYNVGAKRDSHAYLCALPMNLFNEIFYLFFWFWLILLSLFTLGSLFYWLRLVFYNIRKTHIRSIMSDLLTNLSDEDKDTIYGNTGLSKSESFDFFYRDVCSLDLVFVIDLLAINSTNIVSRDILESLWNEYFELTPDEHGKTRRPLKPLRLSPIKPTQQPEQLSLLNHNNNSEMHESDDQNLNKRK